MHRVESIFREMRDNRKRSMVAATYGENNFVDVNAVAAFLPRQVHANPVVVTWPESSHIDRGREHAEILLLQSSVFASVGMSILLTERRHYVNATEKFSFRWILVSRDLLVTLVSRNLRVLCIRCSLNGQYYISGQ